MMRDAGGAVTGIVGLFNRVTKGEIRLDYGETGGLRSAVGKNAKGDVTVQYEYDAKGRLKGVKSKEGTVGYQYRDSRVTKVTWQEGSETADNPKEETNLALEYDASGRLVRKTSGDGSSMGYHWETGPQGAVATASSVGVNGGKNVFQFDTAFRPSEAIYGDGTRVQWQYPEEGGMKMEMKGPNQASITLSESPDRALVTLKTPDWPALLVKKDGAGRVITVSENGQRLLRQHWTDDGRLQRVETETSAVRRHFDRDGRVSSLLLAPPGDHKKLSQFQEIKIDLQGRPMEIRDHRGLHRTIQYAEDGEIRSVTEKKEGKNYGFTIDRDKQGRIQAVESSWGSEKYEYDPEGNLEKVKVMRDDKIAAIAFKAGQIQKIKQFDGGETVYSYDDTVGHAGLLKGITCPNGTALEYHYDESPHLSRIEVGTQSQVILDYDKQGRFTGYAWQPAGQ